MPGKLKSYLVVAIAALIALAIACGSDPVEPTRVPTQTTAPQPTATQSPPTATTVPSTPAATPMPTPQGTVVTLPASKDNTLFEENDGSISNGSGEHIFVGMTNGGSIRRGLVAFDVASQIPTGSTITNVELSLSMSKTRVARQDISVHKMLTDWGEGASDADAEEGRGADAESGDATWIHSAFDTDTWNNPGGDFESAASATAQVVGPNRITWGSTSQLVADVQAWVDSSSSNFGWILVGNESSNQTAKRFDSKENSSESNRPELKVTFIASDSPSPTATPTATAVPPTPTQVPPTATSVPPTATSVPPTATPQPPAVTPTPTLQPGEQAIIIGALKDNTIFEENSGLSNGAGPYIFAGKNNAGGARRALIAFDIANAVPAGAEIARVELTLNMSQTSAGSEDIALHKVLTDWGEGTSVSNARGGGQGVAAEQGEATWSHAKFDTTAWQNQGGDFELSASVSMTIGSPGAYTWNSTEQLVADVQSWLDNPSTNFGWVLLGNESSNQTSKRFNSKEHENEASRPMLRIVYTQSEPTPTPSPTPLPEPQTVTVNPSKDNTLYERADGSLSNGQGAFLFVGNTNIGNARRTLLAFDLDGVIPDGATIQNVELQLNMSKTRAGTQTLSLHKVLQDWGEASSNATGEEGGGAQSAEGDATWIHRRFNTSEMWDNSGGDFVAQASASTSVSSNGSYTWQSTNQLVVDVQSWVDDSLSNFGWILIGNESQNRTAKRFDSKDNGNVSSRPSLTITFIE